MLLSLIKNYIYFYIAFREMSVGNAKTATFYGLSFFTIFLPLDCGTASSFLVNDGDYFRTSKEYTFIGVMNPISIKIYPSVHCELPRCYFTVNSNLYRRKLFKSELVLEIGRHEDAVFEKIPSMCCRQNPALCPILAQHEHHHACQYRCSKCDAPHFGVSGEEVEEVATEESADGAAQGVAA